MKVLVIGDSHGNIANIKHVMGFAKKIKAGAVIHTGDWNNLTSVETVLKYGLPLYSCLGNADIDPRFKFDKKIKLELGGIKIGVVHNISHLDEDKNNFDIVFCGHRHKQEQIRNVVNPGALENGVNFAVYDTKTNEVEFIHE